MTTETTGASTSPFHNSHVSGPAGWPLRRVVSPALSSAVTISRQSLPGCLDSPSPRNCPRQDEVVRATDEAGPQAAKGAKADLTDKEVAALKKLVKEELT
jgi:hypothetical protein